MIDLILRKFVVGGDLCIKNTFLSDLLTQFHNVFTSTQTNEGKIIAAINFYRTVLPDMAFNSLILASELRITSVFVEDYIVNRVNELGIICIGGFWYRFNLE